MKSLHPAKVLVLAYLFYSIIGCILLSLPLCHSQPLHLIDIYFTAISALSTTGLATIDIGSSYNFFGQFIIMLLIQLGGIGYMTFSSFVVLCTAQKLSAYRKKIGKCSFPFPDHFSIHEFIFSVVSFSFLVELLGAIALSLIFWKAEAPNWAWQGIFHSVSAFCTAGLSLFNDGLVPFQDNFACNVTIAALEILGSLGFIVALDFYKKWTRKQNFISFTSKVILWITAAFVILGISVFFALESLREGLSAAEKGMIGFSQVISAITTCGFNTVDIGTLTPAMLLLLAFLSTFGASPSGTGGGLKNTSFASLAAFVKSTLRDQPTTIWRHLIPVNRVKIATVAFIYYVFVLSLALFCLSIFEHAHQTTLALFFEAANALNNSGLSMGITSDLTDVGKICMAILMLMGRVGVLTFGVAISSQTEEKVFSYKKTELIT